MKLADAVFDLQHAFLFCPAAIPRQKRRLNAAFDRMNRARFSCLSARRKEAIREAFSAFEHEFKSAKWSDCNQAAGTNDAQTKKLVRLLDNMLDTLSS